MSDTPRTEYAMIAVGHVRGAPVQYVTAEFARQLERELSAARAVIRRAWEIYDATTLDAGPSEEVYLLLDAYVRGMEEKAP